MNGVKTEGRDGSIFAAFARQGQQPVNVTHRTHTNTERQWVLILKARTHYAYNEQCWRVTENFQSINIVKDCQLKDLLLAGHPGATIPSLSTVTRDVNKVFRMSKKKVEELLKVCIMVEVSSYSNHLQEYPGKLSFATDAWMSPNHQAFVAWTVYLQHEGVPLVFLLDIIEVPEICSFYSVSTYVSSQLFQSHTGKVQAREFNEMLIHYGIADKVCSDNQIYSINLTYIDPIICWWQCIFQWQANGILVKGKIQLL